MVFPNRTNAGFSTVGSLIVVGVLGATAFFAGPTALEKYDEVKTSWALSEAAQHGVAKANEAVKDGRDPVREVRKMSTEQIDVRATPMGATGYCITATYLKRDVTVDPVNKGAC